jgi:MYXO-CTERM domain-containing protein
MPGDEVETIAVTVVVRPGKVGGGVMSKPVELALAVAVAVALALRRRPMAPSQT